MLIAIISHFRIRATDRNICFCGIQHCKGAQILCSYLIVFALCRAPLDAVGIGTAADICLGARCSYICGFSGNQSINGSVRICQRLSVPDLFGAAGCDSQSSWRNLQYVAFGLEMVMRQSVIKLVFAVINSAYVKICFCVIPEIKAVFPDIFSGHRRRFLQAHGYTTD